MSTARVIDENPSHGFCRRRVKVSLPRPRNLTRPHQLQKGFVDQSGRLERVPRSFLHHPLLCQRPQLVVDEWQKVGRRRLIAVRDLPQHSRNAGRRLFTVPVL